MAVYLLAEVLDTDSYLRTVAPLADDAAVRQAVPRQPSLPTARSANAAEAVIDTLLRFLVASLQTLLVAAAVVVIVALLAGPSRPAVANRRLLNTVLDACARALSHAGSWIAPTGRALAGARRVV